MKKDETMFDIKLPQGWEDQTVYFFRGPSIDDREHKVMMTIDRLPQQDEISRFAAVRTRPIVENLQGVEVLKDEETTPAGCYPSYEFVYRWIPADGMKIVKKHIYVLHGRFGYCFEAEFTKKSYKMLGGQLKKLVESLLPGTYEPVDDR